MVTTAEGMREISPLLPNDRGTEDQAKAKEAEKSIISTWRLVTGIGFTWLGSWLAALGRLLASHTTRLASYRSQTAQLPRHYPPRLHPSSIRWPSYHGSVQHTSLLLPRRSR
jgi:hypothetical protein